MKKDGYIIFDYFNSNFLLLNLNPFSERIQDNLNIKEHRYIFDSRIIKEITITNSSNQMYKFVESVKIYSFNELLVLFTKLGYKIVSKYGGYNGEEFDTNFSKRLILVLKHA
ncbi:MAG: hypothetical protein V1773_12650 [bacterium]